MYDGVKPSYAVKTYTGVRLKSRDPPYVGALKEHTALLRLQEDERFVQLKCEKRPVINCKKLPCPALGNEVDTVYLEPLVEAPEDESWWNENKGKIVEAIEAMHKRGVIHYDLRRENIMCRTPRGDPVIIDFGRAQTVSEADANACWFKKRAIEADTLEYIFDAITLEPPTSIGLLYQSS